MKAKIKFLGGVAGNITGSCSLLIIKDKKKSVKILIDAGLIQCNFNDSLERNKEILKYINPAEIDYIILTHSHVDHIGRLPLLTKNGFAGRIICTKGTRSLLEPMLEDSAKIQMAEASYNNAKALKAKKNAEEAGKKAKGKDSTKLGKYDRLKRKVLNIPSLTKKEEYQPLYALNDVTATQSLIKNQGYDYHIWIRLTHNLSIKFYPSGHVMGGSIIVLKIYAKPKDVYLCFTGDLGRRDGIILPPPEFVKEPIDHLVLESTYGGKIHPDRDEEINALLKIIRESASQGKRIIIPSFALERSQEIIYLLSYYMDRGDIPKVPIFLDSPLGGKITASFSEAWNYGIFSDQNRIKFNPFNPAINPYFNITSDQNSSDTLIAKTGSYIVIAGSGMCDAGRVRGHLRENLSKEDTVVCLVGYMAERSLGRRLKDHLPIKMNGQEIDVKAKIISFDSFSAHADGPWLVDYAKTIFGINPNRCNKIFITHGEEESAKNLQTDLELSLQDKNVKIIIPEINDEEEL